MEVRYGLVKPAVQEGICKLRSNQMPLFDSREEEPSFIPEEELHDLAGDAFNSTQAKLISVHLGAFGATQARLVNLTG
jgi:hypothetical protein